MISRFDATVLMIVALCVSGCASVEKTALAPEAKKKIKTIGVVSVPEPDKYVLYPGQAPGGAALYAFGALGGLVLGSIEAARTENATNEFTAAVKRANPDVANHWNTTINALLSAKGYQITLLSPLPKRSGSNETDCSSTAGKFDALLLTSITTGYSVEKLVEPRVLASVRLVSSNCAETYFTDSYSYSANAIGKFTYITRDATANFGSRDELLANPEKAKQGLHKGLTEVAKKATSDF
jgi:hypothetical protein